jgi:hypothetical protein
MLDRSRQMIITETSIAKSLSQSDAIALIRKALAKSGLPMPDSL